MKKLYERYKEEILPRLKKKHKVDNIHELPHVEKVVINVGCGEAAREAKTLQAIEKDLTLIAGQKCRLSRAKKSISNFNIREGMVVGANVTLRRRRAYEFLDRFINISVPRIRDFRGFPLSGFDRHGNYNIGLPDHTFFAEINLDDVEQPFGMNITICTTTQDNELAKSMLQEMNFPFKK